MAHFTDEGDVMWIRKDVYEMLKAENERKTNEIVAGGHRIAVFQSLETILREQKQKDDLTIEKTREEKATIWNTCYNLQGQIDQLRAQKAKDDITIDWMRHRVNALEKQNA